jgi:hypothetical protein
MSTITRHRTLLSGAERTRTADFLLAKQVLYQLSYRPIETQPTCGNALQRGRIKQVLLTSRCKRESQVETDPE